MNNTFNSTSYAERAGKCLKAHLVAGRRAASKEDRKGYRENFAYRLGVDMRTLTRYCNSIHDVDTIALVADLLGLSVGDMLSYDGEDVPYLIKKMRQYLSSIASLIFLKMNLQTKESCFRRKRI